jgi:hypothetical protein
MLIGFFLHLKAARLPVSTREFLTLLEALAARVVSLSLDDFYYLARTTLIKDEAQFDRYDLAFAMYFKGVESIFDLRVGIPEEWLRKEFERLLSDEDKAKVEALGGWDKLMETLKKRLEEQKGRHAGGRKWIGTGGTSPFGAYGYNPEGIRIGQESGGNRSAVKVWDERTFRNLDGDVELNTRNIKVALRRLRRFAREGLPEELDMDGTIAGTARNAGYLDLHLVPERRNRVKVLPVPRRGRLDGSARPRLRGALFGDEDRVPSPRILLLPQLPLRLRLARQRAPKQRAGRDVGHPAQVRTRLEGHLRRRRGDEPVRARPGGRLGRVCKRRAGRRLAQAHRRALPPRDLVEPRAVARVGVHALDADRTAGCGPADVPADARTGSRRASTRCVISGASARCTEVLPRRTFHAGRSVTKV